MSQSGDREDEEEEEEEEEEEDEEDNDDDDAGNLVPTEVANHYMLSVRYPEILLTSGNRAESWIGNQIKSQYPTRVRLMSDSSDSQQRCE